MCLLIKWLDESQTVLQIDFNPPWTWVEYECSMGEAYAMIKAVNHTVDMFLDGTKTTQLPFGQILASLRRVALTMPPNIGVVIAIGGGYFAQSLGRSLMRTIP